MSKGPTRFSFATDGSWSEMDGGDYVAWFEYDDVAKQRDDLVAALDEYLAARKDWESRRLIEYGPRYARLVLANRKLLSALSSAKGTQG
jgi:hypothetical protein